MELSVHHCKINPRVPRTNAQLMDDQRIGVTFVPPRHFGGQHRPNVDVAHS
jgi:hypothetical protein